MRTIQWSFPLPRPHTGIAMGNGLFGALIWGKNGINITLNRSDFWDHRGAYRPTEGITTYARMKAFYSPEDYAWTKKVFPITPGAEDRPIPSRLPFGRLELKLRPGCVPVKGELDLATGTVTVRVTTRGGKRGSVVRFDLSVSRSVLWIDDPGRVICGAKARTAWDWVRKPLQTRGFAKPRMLRKPGAWGWAQACPEDPALAAVCRQTSGSYVVALERGADAEQALDAADLLAANTRAQGLAALRAANAAWWRTYWRRAPRLNVPDEFLNVFYRYALYKFGAATNPNCATPAGLQGPWVEEYQWPPWNADYHFNVNVQQVYSAACAANQMDHLMPLFDRLDSWRDVLGRNAKAVCGIDDGLIVGMCVDDRGEMLYAGPGVLMDHACSGWTAQLFWLYYLHTGDVAFLRDRAYPFMRGVMRVYEEMLEKKDGRLSLPLGISAEFGNDIAPRLMGRDPSSQLACIHMLVQALQKAACILKLPPRPIWRTIEEKLPPYTLIGKPGEERIAIWEGQDLDFSHRHHSHLSCLYPFDTVSARTPEIQQILDHSIDHWVSKGMGEWSEWCMPWAAIIQARMGFKEAPRLILQLWRNLFVNEGLATVYLPRFSGISNHCRAATKEPLATREIMQLDGTVAGITALYELLVHTRGDVTHVFPAVPDDWRDISFADIRVPGAFLIGAERKNSMLRSIRIKSLIGGALTLQVEGYPALMLKRQRGKSRRVKLPARLAFQPGELLILEPKAP